MSSTPSSSANGPSTSITTKLTSGSMTTTKNPISLRLYKVLSTNFEDGATREALTTLSELYGGDLSHSSGSSGVDNTENAGLPSTATIATESYPGEYAAKTRRNLRRDMENKLAEGSQAFLKALEEVDQKLTDLQMHVKAMEQACSEAESQLNSTNETSRAVLERAGSLRDERETVESKKSIISLFLTRFTLTDAESHALTSREAPINQQFFEAMDKTERIRDDCRVLMAGEDGSPTTAGLEILQSTSKNLEQGYEKLLRWISNEFRGVGSGHGKDGGGIGDLDVYPAMSEAVVRLKKRPELLTEALTILSQTRQNALLSSFLTALTRGGPSGLPRPIELHAHDPTRYVGDMLAWVHQAIAAEREFLEGLFGVGSGGRMMGSTRHFASKGVDQEEEEEWIQELMDLAVSKLCVPLKNRILQTVRSQESSIVSYKIANLLQFYLDTMRRTVGPEAVLTGVLVEVTQVSYTVFQTSIGVHSKNVAEIPLDPDDPSLTPPLFVLEHGQILREVMGVYDSYVTDEEAVAVEGLRQEKQQGTTLDFLKILDLTIDPIILSCISGAEEKMRRNSKWDGKVYVVNCLIWFLNLLEPFERFTREKLEMVRKVAEGRVAELVEGHFEDMIKEAGLFEVYKTCLNPPTSEPLSRFQATQPSSLRSALHLFALWLSSPSVTHSDRLSHLTLYNVPVRVHHDRANPRLPILFSSQEERQPVAVSTPKEPLHAKIHKEALKRVVRAYEMICGEVGKEGNRYEAGATLVGSERPFGRGYLLRQIFGVEEDEEDESGSESESENESEDEEDEGEGEDVDEENEEEESDENSDDNRVKR